MKKILDFIFEPVPEDEEEVIVNAPIVKHTFSPKKEEQKETKKPINVPEINTQTKELDVKKKQEEVKKNDLLNKKPSFGIEVDSNKTQKAKTQKHVEIKTFKAEKKYEFQPPMSPIFGVLENHKDSRVIVDNNQITNTHTQIKSHIGTVLSPIYGTVQVQDDKDEDENINFENESTKEVDETLPIEVEEQTTLIDIEDVTSINETNFIDIQKTGENDSFKDYFKAEEIKDEDIKNSSIDDILIKPKDETYIFNRDISLFDDEMED